MIECSRCHEPRDLLDAGWTIIHRGIINPHMEIVAPDARLCPACTSTLRKWILSGPTERNAP